MKKNRKMSAAKVKLETRVSARVSNALYVAAKFVASSQGVTMEEKISELLKKDVAYVSNQKWFIDMIQNEDVGDIVPLLNLFRKKSDDGPSGSVADDQFGGDWNKV